MAITLTVNGTGYSFPQTADESWGDNVTNWASAVTSGMLQKAGGAFTLTAEVDFGASYGLVSAYYKSRTSNTATTGVIRFANNEGVAWRNAANSTDLSLLVNASNKLMFNAIELADVSSSQTLTNKTISGASNTLTNVGYSSLSLTGSIVNADVNASAAIAYSKLALTGSIVNADISNSAAIAYSKLALTGSVTNADLAGSIAYSKLTLTNSIVNADIAASAAIAYSKLSLTGSIVNADIATSAAIAYSKLNLAASIVNADIATGAAIAYSKLSLTGSIVNADISNSAAIALSKLATVTASKALVSDASGYVSASSVTSTELGYVSGVTSAIQTQLNAKAPTSSPTFSGTVTTPLTTAGPVLTSAGGVLSSEAQLAITRGGTGQSTAAAAFNALHPMTTTGDMIYSSSGTTAARLPIGSSGQVLKTVGGVPTWATFSGGINYLSSNPDAEADTSGWATFADGASATPVDGTGGSPNSTWTRTTTSPLRGSGSFLWTKNSGASRQGEGVSYDFTIDAADKGQVLQISFDYTVASGMFADNDMQVWVYNVTDAVMIQPAPTNILNTSVAQRWQGTFQTSTTSSSYRLILYVPVTTNSANTVKFDNFEVGPQKKSYGPFISDWTSWTPTGGWSTNVTYTGRWRRVGDSLEAYVTIALSGAPTGTATVTLPNSLSIDTSKIPTQLANIAPVFGEATGWRGSTAYTGSVGYASATSVVAVTSGGGAAWNATTPATWANGDYVTYSFKVPITGWSSGQLLSSDADTRVVAANVNSSGVSVANSGYTNLAMTTVVVDTHGGVTTGASGYYTIPVSGTYRVTTFGSFTSNVTGLVQVGYGKNSTSSYTNACAFTNPTQYTSLTCSEVRSFVAGDKLYLLATQNSAGSITTNFAYLSVERLSGPSQIAASESVNVFYTNGTGTLTSTPSKITYSTKVKDSHNAYVSGVFTAPVSGTYAISASQGMSTTSPTISELDIYKNGSQYLRQFQWGSQTGFTQCSISALAIPMLAGDTLAIYGGSNGSSQSFDNSATQDWISITRVGN